MGWWPGVNEIKMSSSSDLALFKCESQCWRLISQTENIVLVAVMPRVHTIYVLFRKPRVF